MSAQKDSSSRCKLFAGRENAAYDWNSSNSSWFVHCGGEIEWYFVSELSKCFFEIRVIYSSEFSCVGYIV